MWLCERAEDKCFAHLLLLALAEDVILSVVIGARIFAACANAVVRVSHLSLADVKLKTYWGKYVFPTCLDLFL